jgi:hypothetical protein
MTRSKRSESVVQRVSIEETDVLPVPRGCTGEPVEWHLRQESTLRETIDANGGFHGTFTFHDKGSYGAGLVTGAMYRLAQTQNESFQVGAGGLPMNDTAISFAASSAKGHSPISGSPTSSTSRSTPTAR